MKSTNVASTAPRSTNFCLFSLPPELRELIYECALAQPVWLDHKELRRRQNPLHRRVHTCEGMPPGPITVFPPLLQTCQQVRYEAEKIWYSTARFDYTHSTFFEFVVFIGRKKAGKIRRARILDLWSAWSIAHQRMMLEIPQLVSAGYSGDLELLRDNATNSPLVLTAGSDMILRPSPE